MSEVGNWFLYPAAQRTQTDIHGKYYIYKDKEYFTHAPPSQEESGTIIKIYKITPKQIQATFYRYENNDFNNLIEEPSNNRYKVWPGNDVVNGGGAGNKPYIKLKKSYAMWVNPILRKLSNNSSRFYFDEKSKIPCWNKFIGGECEWCDGKEARKAAALAAKAAAEKEEDEKQTIEYTKEIEESCPDAHKTIWNEYGFSYEPEEPKIEWGDLDQEARMYGGVENLHGRYEYYYNMYHTLMREGVKNNIK